MSAVRYQHEPDLNVTEFQAVLRASTLGERRPVDDLKRLETMLRQANLVITARDGDQLVGVARSITDFVYCCYLSDLAVAQSHQHRGIGRRLIDETQAAIDPAATLILLSAPAAEGFYPKAGFEIHPAAFTRKR